MTELRAEDRGAGGKLKRPTWRKTPSTPYDRPPVAASNQSHVPNSRGWLSKLVDPARRLISTGAVRILPSLFSTYSPHQSPTTPCNGDEDLIQDEEVLTPICSKDIGLSLSTGVLNTNNIEGVSHENNTNDMAEQDNNKMKRIEKILMKKFFSREEIDHLLEILNSKIIDISPVCDKTVPDLDISRSAFQISTSRLSCNPHEEGATPVEIARAYMGSRGPDTGMDSVGKSSKFDKSIRFGDAIFPQQSPKSSVCWPGAVLHGQASSSSSQNRKSRSGFFNSPRTPYSRTIDSSHRTKLEYSGSKSVDIRTIPSRLCHNQSSSRLLVNSSRGMANGSVGPIRGRLSRIAMENNSRVSKFVSNLPNDFTQVKSEELLKNKPECDVNERSTQQEPDASSLTSHTHSSILALRILDHINRNTPTMKEKSAEVALAIKSNDAPASCGSFISKEIIYPVGVSPDAGDGCIKGHRLDKFKFPNKIEDEINNGTNNTCLSAVIPCNGNVLCTSALLHGSEKADISIHSKDMVSDDGDGRRGEKDCASIWGSTQQSNGHDVISMAQQQQPSSLGAKRPVGAITINRPDRTMCTSLGFTFPTAHPSSAALMEPPTPSVMPSISSVPSLAVLRSQFNFGESCKNWGPPLAFSFPCTQQYNTLPPPPNASDIAFGFGQHRPRLSFKFSR